MWDQAGRHLADVPEHLREHLLVGLDEWIGVVHHIIGDIPVVGVDDHLHTVPDIIELPPPIDVSHTDRL